MPYSHSIASAVVLSLVAFFVSAKVLGKPTAGLALAAGVLSHLILDLITHAPDIAIVPGIDEPKFGLGLYGGAPLIAFVVVASVTVPWRVPAVFGVHWENLNDPTRVFQLSCNSVVGSES